MPGRHRARLLVEWIGARCVSERARCGRNLYLGRRLHDGTRSDPRFAGAAVPGPAAPSPGAPGPAETVLHRRPAGDERRVQGLLRGRRLPGRVPGRRAHELRRAVVHLHAGALFPDPQLPRRRLGARSGRECLRPGRQRLLRLGRKAPADRGGMGARRAWPEQRRLPVGERGPRLYALPLRRPGPRRVLAGRNRARGYADR